MRSRQSFFLIFIAYFLASCISNSTPIPVSTDNGPLGSLVYFRGCTSACWVGIEIGKTSFDQAKTILEERYTARNVNIILDSLLWQVNETDSTYGTVTFSNSIANDILLFFHDKEFTVADAVKVLGEPSDVMIAIDPSVPKGQCSGMQLSYPEKGVIVYIDINQAFQGVRESQFISGFRFMSPSSLQNMQLYDVLVDWQGYQDYCEIAYTTPAVQE